MGKQWKHWQTLFGGLQNHCWWWLQPWNWKTFSPWNKRYDQPRQHIKRQRHYFTNKVHLIKAMVFPVVMYRCESWMIKKVEHRRTNGIELRYWRRLLRVPWTARRSNQSILKEISPGCSLEGLMLKLNSNTLATSCEELTHWKILWCWEESGAGGEGDNRGWDGWMASLTWWTWVCLVMNREAWRAAIHGVGKSWTQLSNWTELKVIFIIG